MAAPYATQHLARQVADYGGRHRLLVSLGLLTLLIIFLLFPARRERTNTRSVELSPVDEVTQGFDELRRVLNQRQTVRQPSAPPAPSGPILRRIGPGQENGKRQTKAVRRLHKDNLKDSSSPFVQLPAGSFVKSTFLNGAYVPADQARPLPVRLNVNEGFTGPSNARVPLEGCLALGKAAELHPDTS